MRKTTNFDGTLDTQDVPQEPRKVIPPVQKGGREPLGYFVTAPKSTTSLFRGDVTACTDWAKREAVARSAPLDVRETSTGDVFFSFNAKGKFC